LVAQESKLKKKIGCLFGCTSGNPDEKQELVFSDVLEGK
jgi:hypothetical protein